jgi:hypothetical protein
MKSTYQATFPFRAHFDGPNGRQQTIDHPFELLSALEVSSMKVALQERIELYQKNGIDLKKDVHPESHLAYLIRMYNQLENICLGNFVNWNINRDFD